MRISGKGEALGGRQLRPGRERDRRRLRERRSGALHEAPRHRPERHRLLEADRGRPRCTRSVPASWTLRSWPTSRSWVAPPRSSMGARGWESQPATTRRSAGRSSRPSPKSKYYLLTCETLTGEEARTDRAGLALRGRRRRSRTAPWPSPSLSEHGERKTAIRWTKHTLNHWYRMAEPENLRRVAGLRVPRLRRPRRRRGRRLGTAEKRRARLHRPRRRVARARVGPADAGRETGLAAVECPAPGRGARAKGVRVETLGIGSLTAGRVGLGCDNFGTRIDEERSAAGGAGRASTRA